MKKPNILKITNLPLTRLEDDPDNPNHMSDEQMAALVRAIKVAGFLQPCLVRLIGENQYRIIDGHHRADAAAQAGLSEVPCVIVETDDEVAAVLQIGMNKLRGELNLGEVAVVISNLAEEGWSIPDLEMTGFSQDEIDNLLKAASVATDDEVMEGASMGREKSEVPDEPGGPFELTLVFNTKEDLMTAKRGLKRATEKGGALGDGLLSLLHSQE